MGKTCPYCRHIMSDDDLFCPECGKEYPTGKTCPFCGAAISDDVFCQNCGVIVAKGKACPHCRAALNEGDTFCQNCGARIKKEEESPRVEEKKEEKPVKAEVKDETPKAVVVPQVKFVEPSPEEVTEEEPFDDYPEEKSHKGKYILIVLIVLALIGGGVFFLNNSSEEWESEGEIVTSVSTGNRTLYGTIGKFPITMTIDIEASSVNGFLYYNKYGPSNKLFVSGSLHGNEIELTEHNKDGMETGRYSGKYLNGTIQGKYTNYKGDVFSFYLSEDASDAQFETQAEKAPKSPYDKYKGKWSAYMTDVNGAKTKFLTISINDDLSADHYLYLPDGNTNHAHWEKCVFANGYVYFTINGDYSDRLTPKAKINDNGLLDGDGRPLEKE